MSTILDALALDETVESLPGDLKRFFDDLVGDPEYDFVVPIERSAAVLLRVIYRTQTEVLKKIVSPRALGTISAWNRKTRLLLLDDSIFEGRLMALTADSLRRQFLATVTSAAYLVRRGARWGKPTHYRHLTDDTDYDVRKRAMVYWLLSQGEPLDVEHLAFRMELPTGVTADDFSNLLSVLGDSFEIPMPVDNPEIRLLSTDLDAARDSIYEQLSPEIEPEGVTKVRWFIRGRTVTAIPIVYPAVPVELKSPDRYLLFGRLWPTDVEALPPQVADSRMCFESIALQLSVRLFVWMVTRLNALLAASSQSRIAPRLDEMSVRYSFPGLADALILYVEKELNGVVPGQAAVYTPGKQQTLPYDTLVSTRDDRMSLLRPSVEVALFVLREWRARGGERSSLDRLQSLGVSLSTIRKGLPHLSITDLSRALDEVLDQSALIPTVMRMNTEEAARGDVWVRAYAPGSEAILRRLSLLLSFFDKEIPQSVSRT